MKTIPTCSRVAAALCWFTALLGISGHAATFALNPSIDAFVTAGPTGNLSINNYGGAGALSIAAAGLSKGEFQSVLQFNLNGAKSSFDSQFGAGHWSIQSATLQLTATPPNNSIFNPSGVGQFSVSWMQNDGWTEGNGTPQSPSASGVTFSTLSNFVGIGDEALGVFNFNGATNGNATYSLTLTPSFSAEILAGSTVSFRMFAADSTVSYLFDSQNFGNAALRPLLTISAIPEPGTVCLCAVGVFSWRSAFGNKRR